MLNQIRRWLVAHPRWTLTLLVGVLLGPFLAKPFNIDDPLFIWLAKQVRAHPENPFGFDVNWYGVVQPMWSVTENPPVAGYYLALAGSLLGWNEFSLHLAGLLAAVAVALGTYRLALRCCSQPMLAACAMLFTPLFLVSASTVMCDVVMLAFWVWALVFWMEGLEQDGIAKIVAAGLLVSAAILTKYFGVALLPLLAVHGALRQRRIGLWVVGLVIPLAALGAYQWVTLALYGHPLLSAAMGFAKSVQGELGFSKPAAGLIALAFTGGGAATVLFLAPLLFRARTLAAVAGGVIIVAGALCCRGLIQQKYPALVSVTARTGVSLQLIFWAIGGVLTLVLAAGEVWQNVRDPRSWLLGLWVAGTFFFTACTNWTVNGRSLLPMLPAVGILLARRWEAGGKSGLRDCAKMNSGIMALKFWPLARREEGTSARGAVTDEQRSHRAKGQAGNAEVIFARSLKLLSVALAGSALLALLVAQSDFQLAVAVRRSAEEACARFGNVPGTVWFEGHWGFQYYMEKLGAKAVDFKHGRQLPGDVLVLPAHNTDAAEPAPQIVRRREVVTVPNAAWLTTWNAGVGAGFYSSVVGPLPFALGRVPPETVFVCELKAPDEK